MHTCPKSAGEEKQKMPGKVWIRPGFNNGEPCSYQYEFHDSAPYYSATALAIAKEEGKREAFSHAEEMCLAFREEIQNGKPVPDCLSELTDYFRVMAEVRIP